MDRLAAEGEESPDVTLMMSLQVIRREEDLRRRSHQMEGVAIRSCNVWSCILMCEPVAFLSLS